MQGLAIHWKWLESRGQTSSESTFRWTARNKPKANCKKNAELFDGEKRHWDPAWIRTWVFWILVRCCYQMLEPLELWHWSRNSGKTLCMGFLEKCFWSAPAGFQWHMQGVCWYPVCWGWSMKYFGTHQCRVKPTDWEIQPEVWNVPMDKYHLQSNLP